MIDPAIRSAFADDPESVKVAGLGRFLRGAGADNNPYGRWWFEFSELLGIQEQFDRIPIPPGHRREAILGKIRAATAISVDWNTLSEFWLLEIPLGQTLDAIVGSAKSQPVFSAEQRLHNPKLLFAGGIKQYYFPVINPFWVTRFGSYFDL